MISKQAMGWVFLLLGLAFVPLSAWSAPLPTFYQGVRPLGMGGAFTAVADDYNALVYNPAGLAYVDGFNMDLFNLGPEVSRDGIQLVKDLDNVNNNDTVAVTNVLRAHVGENFRIGLETFPHSVSRGFGMGILAHGYADGSVHSMVNPRVDIETRFDTAAMVAFSRRFLGGAVALGVAGKYVQRMGGTDSFTAVDIAANGFDPFRNMTDFRRNDYALDAGLMIRPSMPLSPTLAVAALNLTDLDFQELGTVPSQVNAGIALHPKLGPVRLTVAADVRDVTQKLSDDKDWARRTHYGAEAQLWKFLAVRAGMGQGYYTAGATVNLWVIRLDLATYGEELGAYGGQKEDRRYIARINFF